MTSMNRVSPSTLSTIKDHYSHEFLRQIFEGVRIAHTFIDRIEMCMSVSDAPIDELYDRIENLYADIDDLYDILCELTGYVRVDGKNEKHAAD